MEPKVNSNAKRTAIKVSLVAAHCKMGEIFLLENGFEKIFDIEVENGAFS